MLCPHFHRAGGLFGRSRDREGDGERDQMQFSRNVDVPKTGYGYGERSEMEKKCKITFTYSYLNCNLMERTSVDRPHGDIFLKKWNGLGLIPVYANPFYTIV